MYKIFFPILLSGIGIYYYYHFKYLNNGKEKINKSEEINREKENEINRVEEKEINRVEENEINRIEEKNVEEEIKLDNMLRY